MFDIKEELKKLPEEPGVYIMHDKNDDIIYVGKAKILKNRVRQYFQNSSAHSPKVRAMVSNIAYFEYIVTDSELEALILECNLIKKHKPRYNILLKDDKTYPYIKITVQEDYPRIFMTRRVEDDGARYFGPYSGSSTIKNTLDIILRIFHQPMCGRKFPDDIGKGRPCLNYHIKNCFAPCTGRISMDEYRRVYEEICSFLEGNHKGLISVLEMDMKRASESLEFERAAALRDKISAVRAIDEKQKIVNANGISDQDIIAAEIADGRAFIEVFFVRYGKVTGRENYRIDNVNDLDGSEIITNFVQQFYTDAVFIPAEIISEYEIWDIELIEKWLSEKKGRRVSVFVPKRGEKKRLVELVKKNAVIAAENFKVSRLKEEEKNTALARLAECLELEKFPERIESYDISNISGSENVGAMVVFKNGYPQRSAYRKFKIKGFEGADDYAAMKEVLYRRFRRALDEENAVAEGMDRAKAKFLPLPDVIFVDGGKGHVSAAMELLDEIEMDIPVFGMVKDNKHRTRAMVSVDGEIEISLISSVFHLVTRIQDEVHRTAISYFRELHKTESVKSELEKIKGIGAKKRAKLLAEFKSMDGIKNAAADELEKVVGRASAKDVWEYFHNQ